MDGMTQSGVDGRKIPQLHFSGIVRSRCFMNIRKEKPEDYFAVESLIRDAFWNVHEPGAGEHYLAHRMRGHADFVDALDLVAEVDGKIVGNIMYTVGRLRAEDQTVKKCLSFGPLAVSPNYQRKGIGKALIETSFEMAKELGYESVVIFGHPANYVARGVVSCKRKNICIGDGIFPTAMLVKELVEDAFDGRRYAFEESEVFLFDSREVEEYDKQFPYKQKKVLPCQEEFYIYSHSSIHE